MMEWIPSISHKLSVPCVDAKIDKFVKLKWEWIFAHTWWAHGDGYGYVCVYVSVRSNSEPASQPASAWIITLKRITDTNDYITELLLPIFFSLVRSLARSFVHLLFSSYIQSGFYISIARSCYFTYRVFSANICHIFIKWLIHGKYWS